MVHSVRRDKREYLYTRQQLEEGKTHDELWNACQLEMVHLGKMHGYMRMYWVSELWHEPDSCHNQLAASGV
jgi:deoxyribodipyrimidine photo-lyase